MKFLIWNNQAQFIGHAITRLEAWKTEHAAFILQQSEEKQVLCCWFTHTNSEGQHWYDVPWIMFAEEFARCRITAANEATEKVFAGIESEALEKQIKRWHWKPGKN